MSQKWITIRIHKSSHDLVDAMAKDMRLPKAIIMDEVIKNGLSHIKKNGIQRYYQPNQVYK